MKRLGIFFFYEKNGVVDEFMAILSLKMPCTPMITVEAMAMTVVMTK